MPLNLAKVAQATAETTVTYEGEPVRLTYRASAYTPKLLAELSALQAASDTSDVGGLAHIVGLLAGLLVGWDAHYDGEPYPVTVDALEKLPLDFLVAVFGAIAEDARVGEANGARRSKA